LGFASSFAAHPELLAPVLQIIHRVIARFLIKQAGLNRSAADTGAVTLIQRFGSAANLSIHLHCLVLDGVYRSTGNEAVFQEARAAALLGAAAGSVPSGLTCAKERLSGRSSTTCWPNFQTRWTG